MKSLTTAKSKVMVSLLALCVLSTFILPIEAYAAIFPNKSVPILMYHKVDDRTPSIYFVSLHDFRDQAFFLQDQGYTSVTMQDLYDHLRGIKELPAKPVIFTFDDAYDNLYSHAMPLLAERGFIGNGDIGPTDYIGANEPNRMSNTWDIAAEYYCAQAIWPEVTALYNNGWEIVAHSQEHKNTSDGTYNMAKEVASNTVIATKAGIPAPKFYCYPFGSSTASLITALKTAGYLGATNASGGIETTTRLQNAGDPCQINQTTIFGIYRVPVNGGTALSAFATSVGGTVPSKPVLTVSTVGNGSVQITPDQPYYNVGTVVTLTAVPDPGYTFSAWSGGLTGSTNPTNITMDASKTVTATFVATGTLPFYDGFESGGVTVGGWTLATGAAVSTTQAYTGTNSLRLAGSTGTTTITKAQSTVGYNTIHVKYDRHFVNTTSVTLVVDWSTDGTNWNVLETATVASGTAYAPWVSKDFTCASGADNNAGFRIRFRTTAGASTQYVYIDNVEITPPVAPRPAASPIPETSAINVGLTMDLGWTAGSGATSHDVYFGTAASPPFIGNQTGTISDTGTLAAGTTYYWRIDEKNATGTTTGTVWNFTTIAAPGQATTPNPANTADVNLPATLSWTAGSGTTSHDVYFGTAVSPPFIGNQAGTTYAPTLTTSTTYYWRIDEKGPGGTTTGTVWSFTTTSYQPPVPPVVGTVTTNTSSSARTSATFSHTVTAGDNRLLTVSVMLRGNITGSSVTYGGAALTKAISRASGTTGGTNTEIWYLINPPVGTASVVVNFSASADPSAIAAVNITGVDQSSPIGATASALATSGTNITTNITTLNASSLIFGAATAYGGDTDPFTPDSGITELWDNGTGTSTTLDNGEWGGYRLAATAGAYTFNTTAAVSDDWTIAAAEIKAVSTVSPPSQATTPNPTNGATGVGVTTDLSWAAGSGATSRDVYFGTANPPVTKVITDGTALTYDTGTMSYNTTYYWRVDEKNAGGTTTGTLWSFTTAAPPQYTLTINTIGSGTVAKSPDQATYAAGTVVQLQANAATGWSFGAWSGALSGSTNPQNLTITGNMSVTATFTINTFTLIYNAGANGSIVGTSPQTIDYGSNGSAVSAVANTGYHFVNWSDSSTANPRTDLNVTAGVTVTANFAIDTFTLTYTPGANGTISGTSPQTVDYGGNGSAVSAVANTGYHFVNWSDSSTANPRTDLNVTAGVTVTANFAIDTFTLTYTAGANGTISGTSPQTIDYGSNGSEVTAVANTGYHFVNWSDSSTANPRTDLNVTAGITVTANFAIDTFTLTYTAGANGTISGTSPQTVDYGGNGSAVSAVANTGYHFVNWSDSSTANPRTDLNVTAGITVTANFAIDTFALTYTAGDNGTISGTSPQTVDYGSNGSEVTAVANTGYHFVNWSDSSTANPRTDLNVTAGITVTANFAIDTFTVSASAGANGGITPSGDTVKDYGSSQLFTAAPDIGYEVDKWTVDGDDVQTGGTTYTLSDITAGHTVSVIFNRIIFSISGYIFEPDGNTPVAETFVSAGDVNTVTDANGYYTLAVEYGWTGVVAPQKEEYVFEPNSDTYTGVTQNYTDANYTAQLMTFVIAGHVFGPDNITPISDVNVTAENGGGAWTSKYGGGTSKTDENGYYEVVVDYNYTGKVMPDKYAYAFVPNGLSYSNVLADRTGQDYTGTLMTFKITGYIKNGCNVPVAGVLVIANNGGGQGTTNAEGLYEIWVNYAWSGTVTPEKQRYTFAPAAMDYVEVLADQADRNYVANDVYDLDCDALIGLGDVGVLAENWLLTGTGIAGDFNADEQIDFLDFADFANVWNGQ